MNFRAFFQSCHGTRNASARFELVEYKLAAKIVEIVKALNQLSHDARTKNESNFQFKFNVTACAYVKLSVC